MELKSEIKNYISDLTKGLYKGYELQFEKLCDKLSLEYFVADFDDNISGSIVKNESNDRYTIYINRKHPSNRQRFTLAHEIGHYISFLKNSYSKEELEIKGGFEDQAVSYRKEVLTSPAETEANLIAAELLMPKTKINELMKKELTPREMAEKFYVSPSAMTIRLQYLYKDSMIT